MAIHPDMMAQMIREHQRDLLREASQERLARQALSDRPRLGVWLLQRVSAILIAAGRALEPKGRSEAGVPDVPTMLASN